MTPELCPFCEIVAGRAPATVVYKWSDTIAIVPLHPVVDGHTLVIPKRHVQDFASDPAVSADAMLHAAQLMRWTDRPMNLITSRGREATQSVFHLHLHLVPRAEGDGLALPWDSVRDRIAALATQYRVWHDGGWRPRDGHQIADEITNALTQEPR